MGIMTAGVHGSGDTGRKGQARFFLHRQSIHIRPQAQSGGIFFFAQIGHQAALTEGLGIGDLHGIQLFLYLRHGFRQVKAHLRDLVEPAVAVNGIIVEFLGQCFHHDRSFLSHG